MSDKLVNIVASDGAVYPQKLVDNGDGTYSLQVAVSAASGGAGGAGGAGGQMVTDANGARWLWVLDTSKTPPTSTYYSVANGGAVGTPATPITVDSDPDGLTIDQLRNEGLGKDSTLTAIRDRLPSVPPQQPLTDTQLRASAVPVSGPLTAAELTTAALATQATAATIATNTDVTKGAGAVDSKTQRVTPAYAAPAAWAGTSFDARAYSSVTIAVTAAPTGARTIQWSPDNAAWFDVTGVTLALATITNIAIGFTGAISVQGGGYIRLNGGAGGTFQIGGAS